LEDIVHRRWGRRMENGSHQDDNEETMGHGALSLSLSLYIYIYSRNERAVILWLWKMNSIWLDNGPERHGDMHI
jgi:hypothetical protein